MEDYEYPYGEMQVHEALEDLDRRLKALEPKAKQGEPAKPAAASSGIFGSTSADKPAV